MSHRSPALTELMSTCVAHELKDCYSQRTSALFESHNPHLTEEDYPVVQIGQTEI